MIKKYPVSIAPMMDWTDRHYRFFMRQITKKTLLYTEMITMNAILNGNKNHLLDFSEIEKPLVIQLGGDNPQKLAECAKICEDWNYDEINLNIGCPSERVQNGNFGACLMTTPEVVAECVNEMKKNVKIPITIKNRIGIDEKDSYEDLYNFIKIVSEAGCEKFIVHARSAILKGLSPKENRTVPPLRYDYVYKIKKDFPNLIIEINGGIKTVEDIQNHLNYTDGVMIGREAYENPYVFSDFDKIFFDDDSKKLNRREIIENLIPYVDNLTNSQIKANKLLVHLVNLFNHKQGTKIWKRYLSENMHKKEATSNILKELLLKLPDFVLDEYN
ncbi:MAG: tRNA dihydrouridine(20/20a) synthase DusA [Cyanobacteriota bacterium]